MERIPKSGEFYRHFKDKLYQVITVAEHSETRESMVVYQALYGDYRTYVRPLTMFVSEVDHIKYPDVHQRYRFERVDMNGQKEEAVVEENGYEENSLEQEPNPYLLDFIEAETYEQKLECLAVMKGKLGKSASLSSAESVGQTELNIIYVVLDMDEIPGSLEEQINAVEKYLLMQKQYDGNRLR